MRAIETSAKTRKEAIQKALDKLGVELHEVDIDILDEGSNGFLGIGMRDVTVRVAAEHLPDEKPAEKTPKSGNREGGNRPGGANRDGKNRGSGGGGSNRDSRGRQGGGNRGSRGKQSGSNREGRRQEGGNSDTRRKEVNGNRDDSRRREGRGGGGTRDERSKQHSVGGAERDARGKQGRGKQSGQRESRATSNEASASRGEAPRRPRPLRKARTTPLDREAAEAIGNTAAALLQEVIGKMGMESSVASSVNDEGDILLDVSAEDSAILIGRKGRNLSAMQFLINRMALSGEDSEPVDRIIVDVEGYLERRRTSLEEMAVGLAKKAMDTGRTMRVKPLDPHDRRIIHLVLKNEEGVRTYSLGNSLHRRVVIVPQNGDEDTEGIEEEEQNFDDQTDDAQANGDQADEDTADVVGQDNGNGDSDES